MRSILGRLPTIPEYYRDYIDNKVDLLSEPKQCCPFHKEDTPSFSYSAQKGVWRCFGGCHCGGDVIALHKKNYNLKTREEAENSLNSLYGVQAKIMKPVLSNVPVPIDEDSAYRNTVFAKAIVLANTPDRWDALDYVMSITPVDASDVDHLLKEWTGEK